MTWQRDSTAADEMPDGMKMTEAACYVGTWGLVRRVDAAEANDGVIRFKSLCCKENRWTETPHVVGKMKQDMELAFVEPLRVPERRGRQKIVDSIAKVFLIHTHEDFRIVGQYCELLTR
jgi:hypothetical protein